MPNYSFLKRLLGPSENALERTAARELTPIERAAGQYADNLPEVIEQGPHVQGEGTSKASFSDDLPIQDVDVVNNPQLEYNPSTQTDDNILNSQLNDVKLGTPESDKLSNYKKMAGVLGVGGVATLALNSGGSNQPPSYPIASMGSQAPIVDQPPVVAPKVDDNVVDKQEPSELEKTYRSMMAQYSRPSSDELAVKVPQVKEIDFGSDESAYNKQALADAMKTRDKITLLNQLGKSFGQIGAGMGRTDVANQDVYDENIKGAGSGIEDVKTKIALQKNDPNSAMSKGYKQIAAAMGFNVKGDATAESIEKLIPQIANVYNQQNAIQARASLAKDNRLAKMDELRMRLAATKDSNKAESLVKEEASLEKDRQKFGDLTNFSKQARGNAAQIENLVNQGERLQTLIDSIPKKPNGEPDLSKVTPIQKQELLRTFDTLLAGKSTVSGQQELMKSANSIYNNAAQLQQYLTGNKAYGNEAGLLKSIVDTINREKGLAVEKIKDMSYNNSLGFKRLNEKDPKYVKQILNEKAQMDDNDIELRKAGFRANDINRLLNSGYSREEIVALASKGKKAKDIQSKVPGTHKPAAPLGQPGASGLTPEQRRKRIEELQAKQKAKLGQ